MIVPPGPATERHVIGLFSIFRAKALISDFWVITTTSGMTSLSRLVPAYVVSLCDARLLVNGGCKALAARIFQPACTLSP